MNNRAKYIAAGVLLLATGLFLYHFYAAAKAEANLDQAIQEIAERPNSGLDIRYSAIDVHPFTGDIRFSDISVSREQETEQAGSVLFDLGYSDLLGFTLWGAESGLKRIDSGNVTIYNLSHNNRQTGLEISADTLKVEYRGNLWNLLVSAVIPAPIRSRHDLRAAGTGFRFHRPESIVGTLLADSLQLDTPFGRQPTDSDSLSSFFSLTGITWGPPPSFRQKYQFFIQGFGYPVDRIPFKEISASWRYLPERNVLSVTGGTLRSELFITSVQGDLVMREEQAGSSQLQEVSVRIHETSPRFQNVLQQLQKLFGLELPGDGKELHMVLNGSLAEPEVSFQP